MGPLGPTSIQPTCHQPIPCRLDVYVHLSYFQVRPTCMRRGRYAMSACQAPAPCQEECNGMIMKEGMCLSNKVKTSSYRPSHVRAGARAAGVQRWLVPSWLPSPIKQSVEWL